MEAGDIDIAALRVCADAEGQRHEIDEIAQRQDPPKLAQGLGMLENAPCNARE